MDIREKTATLVVMDILCKTRCRCKVDASVYTIRAAKIVKVVRERLRSSFRSGGCPWNQRSDVFLPDAVTAADDLGSRSYLLGAEF